MAASSFSKKSKTVPLREKGEDTFAISATVVEQVKEARNKSKELSRTLDKKMKVSFSKLQRVISR